jgi:hypothetical protein
LNFLNSIYLEACLKRVAEYRLDRDRHDMTQLKQLNILD